MEDYQNDMEMLMIRVTVEEDREVTMAMFFNELNREIYIVDLQHYVKLEDMLYVAMKLERQLKKNRKARYPSGSSGSNSSWKPKWENNKGDRPVSKGRVEIPKGREESASKTIHKV